MYTPRICYTIVEVPELRVDENATRVDNLPIKGEDVSTDVDMTRLTQHVSVSSACAEQLKTDGTGHDSVFFWLVRGLVRTRCWPARGRFMPFSPSPLSGW